MAGNKYFRIFTVKLRSLPLREAAGRNTEEKNNINRLVKAGTQDKTLTI